MKEYCFIEKSSLGKRIIVKQYIGIDLVTGSNKIFTRLEKIRSANKNENNVFLKPFYTEFISEDPVAPNINTKNSNYHDLVPDAVINNITVSSKKPLSKRKLKKINKLKW